MMAKPAATKIRLRKKNDGYPLRPDPALLRQLPPPPTPEHRRRRSLRPRRRRQVSEDDAYELDHSEGEDEQRSLRKLRLVVKPLSSARHRRVAAVSSASSSSFSLSPSPSSSSSSSYVNDEGLGENGVNEIEDVKPPKKRRIGHCCDVTVVSMCRSGHQEQKSKKNAVGRSSGDGSGNLTFPWSETPLPHRNELDLILHMLQKKDTYGAFAEPVELEELPDYHDVIEHPMDFGTIRKKLDRGAYCFFEQFEDDILLICSNAMQYNAPDTVYFRQACTIHDLAKKKFQNVREKAKCTETEPTDQRYEENTFLTSKEKKSPPKIRCKAILEPLASDPSSSATLASAGDTSTGLSTVNGIGKSVAVNEFLDATYFQEESKEENCVTVNGHLDSISTPGISKQEQPAAMKILLNAHSFPQEEKQEKSVTVNELFDSSSLGESKQDKGDDFSVKCSPSKLGRKPALVDESRRETYSTTTEKKHVEFDLVVDFLEDQQKQLVSVGHDIEHSYARSLARFTASLGPVAWHLVSKKINKILPPGINFGPGWVGEYEPFPTPILSAESRNPQFTDKNPTSSSRLATKDKATEIKSCVRISTTSDVEIHVKKHLISKDKAPDSSKNTSCENSEEKKANFLDVCSTVQSKSNGAGGQKPHSTSNSINLCANNQMNSTSSLASVRVKEESSCEDIVIERRRDVTQCSHLNSNKKNQTTVDFPKDFSSALPQALSGKSASFPIKFPRDIICVQTETQKAFLDVSPQQNFNAAPESGIRGSTVVVTRVNTNTLDFITSNQTGVNYDRGRGCNHDRSSNDSFKLASFSGKANKSQQNVSRSDTSHVEQSIPIVSHISKENFSPATSAAAKAWMSVGSVGQWKPVDAKIPSEKPSISLPFCSPTWRPPISQFNGYSVSRPASFPLQVEATQVKNRGLVIFPQLIPTDFSKYQNLSSWQGSSSQGKQRDNLPPDLNIGYQAPASPIQPSNMSMDSQQPDLALQL